MTKPPKQPKQPKRECGSCGRCCEGWLTGEVYGQPFWPGRPCHFRTTEGCSIYAQRPAKPCKAFKCMWLEHDSIPAWMKPDEVNAIFTWRAAGNITYMSLHEAGEKLRSDVLSWTIHHAIANNINLLYHINGGQNRIGTPEFIKADLSQSYVSTSAEVI